MAAAETELQALKYIYGKQFKYNPTASRAEMEMQPNDSPMVGALVFDLPPFYPEKPPSVTVSARGQLRAAQAEELQSRLNAEARRLAENGYDTIIYELCWSANQYLSDLSPPPQAPPPRGDVAADGSGADPREVARWQWCMQGAVAALRVGAAQPERSPA